VHGSNKARRRKRQIRDVFKFFDTKPLGRNSGRWEDNTNIDYNLLGYKDSGYITAARLCNEIMYLG
jgi:hypothetical protein